MKSKTTYEVRLTINKVEAFIWDQFKEYKPGESRTCKHCFTRLERDLQDDNYGKELERHLIVEHNMVIQQIGEHHD